MLISLLLDPSFLDHADAQTGIVVFDLLTLLCGFPDQLLIDRALDGANPTAFTKVEIKADHLGVLCIHQDARIRTKEPTLHTVDAGGLTKNRAKSPPSPGLVLY
jgi:hypothetical protein